MRCRMTELRKRSESQDLNRQVLLQVDHFLHLGLCDPRFQTMTGPCDGAHE